MDPAGTTRSSARSFPPSSPSPFLCLIANQGLLCNGGGARLSTLRAGAAWLPCSFSLALQSFTAARSRLREKGRERETDAPLLTASAQRFSFQGSGGSQVANRSGWRSASATHAPHAARSNGKQRSSAPPTRRTPLVPRLSLESGLDLVAEGFCCRSEAWDGFRVYSDSELQAFFKDLIQSSTPQPLVELKKLKQETKRKI